MGKTYPLGDYIGRPGAPDWAVRYKYDQRRVWYRYLHMLAIKHGGYDVWNYWPQDEEVRLRVVQTGEFLEYRGPLGIEDAARVLGSRFL